MNYRITSPNKQPATLQEIQLMTCGEIPDIKGYNDEFQEYGSHNTLTVENRKFFKAIDRARKKFAGLAEVNKDKFRETVFNAVTKKPKKPKQLKPTMITMAELTKNEVYIKLLREVEDLRAENRRLKSEL